jgi:F0F1-type ATP synthase membrane subunit c/vacuolar-type H+-ATPase subunit K
MGQVLKLLRTVQLAMLGSIVLYALVGEFATPRRIANPTLSYIFTTMGVAVVGVIFVVRRTLVLRSGEVLAEHPDDRLAVGHWRTGYFATYGLCEALALFGLILRVMGFSFQQSLPFYVGGFVLLIFFGPRQPSPPIT